MSTCGNRRAPGSPEEHLAESPLSDAHLDGEPTYAERARTVMAAKTFGALSTQSTEIAGFPFGSLTGYALDDRGIPVMCLSNLAEHSRNIAANPASSLLVAEQGGDFDMLARGRVTLLGELTKLDGQAQQAAQDRYLAAHPSAGYATYRDFAFYRLEVAHVRYVSGFGRMTCSTDWVAVEDYATAEPDTLFGVAAQIVTHMNDDHADALLDYRRAFGQVEPTSAQMIGVDRYGMNVIAHLPDGEKRTVRINFTERTDTKDGVRRQTVALLRDARVACTTGHRPVGTAATAR